MKIKALMRTIKKLEKISLKVRKNPSQVYDMRVSNKCVIGVHYGTFYLVNGKIFKDFKILYKSYKENSVKAKVSDLFYGDIYKLSYNVSSKEWLEECNKVLRFLRSKLTKKLDKSITKRKFKFEQKQGK